ncbi:MAG: diphthine--ammonia ligase [Candidatus Bathyarchaeia archaeon]
MLHVVASWSGGKDSCLALYKAALNGFKVSYLLNFISKDRRCMSHGLNPELIAAQSQAVGIPIIQRETTWDAYEEIFKATLIELKRMGIEGAVFGDIHVKEHLDWVNRVCNEAGIIPLEPLWGMDPERVLRDFIDAGFKAIVVNVKADLFGEEWLGREVDLNFLNDLQKLRKESDFDLCGEYGEYHTFVIDGPIFKKRIKILESKRVRREGYWRYWLLDILRFRVEEKGV